MIWYYIDNGEQRGPVTAEDLGMLLGRGAVTPDTLVWREGLENWRPYREIKPAGATSPPILAPGQAVCCECQRVFPLDEVIRHGDVYVCGACKPVFLQKLREGIAPVAAMRYAGFWIRAGAKILDGIILAIPTQAINLFLIPRVPTPSGGYFARVALVTAMNIVIAGAYNVLMVGKYGATVGKMAAKLKIVNPDGSPVSYGKAVARFFAEFLSAAICYIGYFMVGFDTEEKRALHDRICGTRVIRK
jgi:uncharacterized RDD family membrane protein YckC